MSLYSKALARAGKYAGKIIPDKVKRVPFWAGAAAAGGGIYGGAKAWDYALSHKSGSPAVDAAAETLRNIWAPALATAVASGAAGGLLASRSHSPGETTAERRRRILNSALVSGAAGGTAVAAIPTAYSLLSNPATYRDKYGSGGIFGSVAGGITNTAKYGGGALGGILLAKFGLKPLGIKGFGAANKAVRDAANYHVTGLGRKLGDADGKLFTAARRMLADPTLSEADAVILRGIANDLPGIARRMANGGEISNADMSKLIQFRGRQLSDGAKKTLTKTYGVENTNILDDALIDGLPNLVRQAGRINRNERGVGGHFFDFVNPSINSNNPNLPFHTVADPRDMANTLKTHTGKVQASGYIGAGLGGHTLYHSVVPSL